LTDISQIKDTMGTWYYHAIVTEMGVHPEEAMVRTAEMTRDKNRTPMQWSNTPNAGFSPSGVNPWLPVNPNYKDDITVKEQEPNPASLLNYYKRLLRARKGSTALQKGEYIPLQTREKDYFSFLRKSDEQIVLVILNYSQTSHDLDFTRVKEIKNNSLRILFSSAERRADHLPPNFKINPFEVFVAEVINLA
jgi:glycosidase